MENINAAYAEEISALKAEINDLRATVVKNHKYCEDEFGDVRSEIYEIRYGDAHEHVEEE